VPNGPPLDAKWTVSEGRAFANLRQYCSEPHDPFAFEGGALKPRIGTPIALVVGVAAAVAVSGCGDADHDGVAKPDSSGVITVTARNVKFVPDEIELPAGQTVTLMLENEDGQEHDLQVTGLEVEVIEGGATGEEHEIDTPDDSMETPEHGGSPRGEMGPIALHTAAHGEDSVTFVATAKGEYEFWCTITGHKEAGMVGTLTVE
jgi:uncharacterized cupredoxin-like copper-binding protein